mmetsp:Transcript_57271/g.121546  ORF Transcript_57271/g.121546 Transcript_57271/m.121546 type:complete len:135 (-) Transcript_57271:174-578(-)
MRKYHKSAQSIPEYINMLEATQRKAGRIKKRIGHRRNPIDDDNLLYIAVTVQLELQQFPRKNMDWEKLREDEKRGQNGRQCTRNCKTLPTSEPLPQADRMRLGERLTMPPQNWSQPQVVGKETLRMVSQWGSPR